MNLNGKSNLTKNKSQHKETDMLGGLKNKFGAQTQRSEEAVNPQRGRINHQIEEWGKTKQWGSFQEKKQEKNEEQ